MKRNENDGGKIPEVNIQKTISLTCDLCNETIVGQIYDHTAFINAVVSGDKQKSQDNKLTVVGWVCPYCGFTYCKKGKHNKELGIKFWSIKDPSCIRCKRTLPASVNLLLVSKEMVPTKENKIQRPGIIPSRWKELGKIAGLSMLGAILFAVSSGLYSTYSAVGFGLDPRGLLSLAGIIIFGWAVVSFVLLFGQLKRNDGIIFLVIGVVWGIPLSIAIFNGFHINSLILGVILISPPFFFLVSGIAIIFNKK
jgi:hypothetical protein